MTAVLNVAGGILVTAGVALIAIGGLGLLRLPDLYNRLNAVGKAAGLGLVCVLFGALLLMPSVPAAVALLLAVVLQLLTAPLGAYAIGSAAYRAEVPLTEATGYDEYRRPEKKPPSE